MDTDNSNKWEATKEDESEEQKEHENNRKDENNKKVADYLKLKKKFPTWHIVPEVINRQIGSNPLFERRFYSSLYAVERFQLMYKFYLPVTVNYSFYKCTLNYTRFYIVLKVSLSYSRNIIYI